MGVGKEHVYLHKSRLVVGDERGAPLDSSRRELSNGAQIIENGADEHLTMFLVAVF